MRFWDSSAVVALLAAEPASEPARATLADDADIAVWWGSRVECVSAVRRRERAGELDRRGVAQSLALLDRLTEAWFEVLPGAALRAGAERALAVHPLRAAGALQLAGAIVWRGSSAAPAELVCFDDRLRDAAEREGFILLPGRLD